MDLRWVERAWRRSQLLPPSWFFLLWQRQVLDKEPSLPRLWAVALALGFAGLLAWSRHVVLGVIVTLIAVAPALAVHAELVDPYVGPPSCTKQRGPLDAI